MRRSCHAGRFDITSDEAITIAGNANKVMASSMVGFWSLESGDRLCVFYVWQKSGFSRSEEIVYFIYFIDIVTYSGVLFTMELYCTPKSQPTTVKHNQQLFEQSYTSNLYGLGTLNSHSCSQKASKHTCCSRNFLIRTQSSNQKESVAKHTHTSALGDFQTRLTISVEFRRP
jgi:hypothetical protein